MAGRFVAGRFVEGRFVGVPVFLIYVSLLPIIPSKNLYKYLFIFIFACCLNKLCSYATPHCLYLLVAWLPLKGQSHKNMDIF